MRQVVLISAFWPTRDNPISGVFVVQQIAAFCRAGWEVTVLVGRAVGRTGQDYLTPAELGLPGAEVELVVFPYLRFPQVLSATWLSFGFNLWSYGTAVSRRLKALRHRRPTAQLCLAHGLVYPGLALPYWADAAPAPMLVCLHGVDPFLTLPAVRRFIAPLIKAAEARAQALVLVGSPLRRHADELGFAAGKCVVVANGAELPVEEPASPPRAPAQRSVHVASVSNLIALKGIDDNLHALHRLKATLSRTDWRYSIVGDGPERARLEALVTALGLDDQVRFLGRLSYAETMAVMASADIFSVPSWGEAFGIVYLEAMARGCPTIGCLDNGAADIITSGVDGFLVPPKNPQALAAIFETLIADPELRRRIGEAARRTARGFTWDVNVARLVALAEGGIAAPMPAAAETVGHSHGH